MNVEEVQARLAALHAETNGVTAFGFDWAIIIGILAELLAGCGAQQDAAGVLETARRRPFLTRVRLGMAIRRGEVPAQARGALLDTCMRALDEATPEQVAALAAVAA